MYHPARTALAVTFLIAASAALSGQSQAMAAEAPKLSPDLARVLDQLKSNPKLKQRFLAELNRTKSKSQAKVGPAAKETPKEPDAITKLIQSNMDKPPSERQYSRCAGFVFFLRQDWKDVGSAAGAACPDAADEAQGAEISFANDLAAKNRIATLKGTAAVIYNSITGDVPFPRPYAISIGAYTTVDNVSNSAASQLKSNVDTLAYGGLINLGFVTSVGANYFMLRAGGVEDHIKNTSSASVVLDWSPVIEPLYIHYPFQWVSFGLPIITRFDADLVGRFDSATGDKQVVAFNNMRDSLRVGPELALTILPDIGYVSGILTRFSALIGYDVWYETYSKKDLTWFTSSLKYNIDEAGNFALKGTYNTGRDVNTGTFKNIYTIGLSGKI
jgi:hypothetical protein